MARILLVEDHQEIWDFLSRRLKRRGHEISVAEDGQAGLDQARAEKPELILLDMNLPVMDGWEATRQLKSDGRTAHIPVVALTAHDGSGELQRATRAGCDWFVPKPCPPDALIAEVRRVLSSPPRSA